MHISVCELALFILQLGFVYSMIHGQLKDDKLLLVLVSFTVVITLCQMQAKVVKGRDSIVSSALSFCRPL